jgi:hypothetical protein
VAPAEAAQLEVVPPIVEERLLVGARSLEAEQSFEEGQS